MRTCGSPLAGSGENASETKVMSTKQASGFQMGGMRSFAPESRSATRQSASRIWHTAMENRTATDDPKAR